MHDFRVGMLAGLTFTAAPSAVLGTLLLWLALGALGSLWLGLPPLAAAVGGLAAALLHWLGEAVHQLGHARAARRTGHPMRGVRLWLVLGSSLYPPGEGELPGPVHIRRALGGPAASLVFSLAAAVLAALLFPLGGLARYLSLFLFLDNLAVYTLGSLLPLGFTDGSTLWTWWGKRQG
jgi:hypothetical protein